MGIVKKRISMLTWLQRCVYLLLIVSVLVNLKSIFTDFDGDLQYAVGMSYRMLKGDQMFVQMWEPHQTSAFLITFFMGLYLAVTKATVGVVLFLQIVGVLLQGILAIVNYRMLKKRIDPTIAMLMSIFLFTARPKGVVMPEFSNMQIGFSVLLLLCLIGYLEDQKKKRLLLASSVCLCLEVLSYPSCIIVYFAVVFALFLYSDNRLKDILLFSLLCFLQGMCYILYFVWKIGFSTLLNSIPYILKMDSLHDLSSIVRNDYFLFFGQGILWMLVCFFLAVAAGYVWCHIAGGDLKSKVVMAFGIWVFLSGIALVMLQRGKLYYGERAIYLIVYLIVICAGGAGVKHLSAQEKRIYLIGMLLTMGSFFAVCFFTNLDLLSIVGYLTVGTMISFLPLGKWLERNMLFAERKYHVLVLLLFCAMVAFQRGYILRAMNGYAIPLTELIDPRSRGGMVKEGPATGIITDYMGAYSTRCDMEDFEIYINSGDRLFIVSAGSNANALMYMYQNVIVCTPSTICTPTYNETLLDYWEQNPDKCPNVILVECWFGDLHIDQDSWIYQWIEEEFQPSTYVDGRYWRFYRLAEGK